ncbi:MAG: trigger factor [Desulfovibrio sp.]|jgi:trigger factor|nr:trigger factor [Desulfovibrio sp.]
MQHVIEDLSPVKKKITVTFPVEETDAAFSSAVSILRRHVRLNGFRPGKVPPEIIEKRFYDDVCRQTASQLIDERIEELLSGSGFHIMSPVVCDGGKPERGKEFSYSITFEVLPEFEIPDYRGMPVEQEETVVTDEDVDDLLAVMRDQIADVVPVDEDRTPEDGDLVLVDWVFLDEEGAVMPDYKVNNKLITVEQADRLPDVEALLKSMKPGEEKEGPVTFPPDYDNEELAGRTLSVRITLDGIRKKILPELDGTFTQLFNVDTPEQLRDKLRETIHRGRESRNRTEAQRKLAEELARHTDFPLPESMVAEIVEMFADDFERRMQDMGTSLDAQGKTADDLHAEVRPHAEQWVRVHVLLLSIARQMGLTVSDMEVTARLHRLAERSGRDYATVRAQCERHNHLPKLRNELLAEKAMNEIYAAAAVTMIPPAPQETDTNAENSADSAAAPAATAEDEAHGASAAAQTSAEERHTAPDASDAKEYSAAPDASDEERHAAATEKINAAAPDAAENAAAGEQEISSGNAAVLPEKVAAPLTPPTEE